MSNGKLLTLSKPRGRCSYAVQWFENKRKRAKYFRTSAEAKKFLALRSKRAAQFGAQAATLTPAQVEEYLTAKRLVGGAYLPTVFRERTAHAAVSFKPLNEAAEAFIELKKGANRSDEHLARLKRHLNALLKRFPSWEDIEPTRLTKWLLTKGAPKTIRNVYTDLRTFFREAYRQEWVSRNPMERISIDALPKIIRGSKPYFLIEETKALFGALIKKYPQFVPFYAICAFAGIRRAEAMRFKWDYINEKNKVIILPAEICKTADFWTMDDLPDNLWAWLKRPADNIWRAPSEWYEERIHELAPNKWANNGLRHSFATYHASRFRDRARTQDALRHTLTEQQFKSYLGAMLDRKSAANYFEIVPKNCP